jgi:transposase
MDVVYTHCAGLDVHKKSVVACAITPSEKRGWHRELRTFGTMTADLLALTDWLAGQAITHVAMESTGEYWRPIFNILEGSFEVLLVNAQHIKAVPGRKTDIKDAAWIAELLQHGLLRASFIPPPEQRDLRDLTRHRTNFVRDRATLVNRVQKVLEGANIKLGSVASDVMGASGRAMLEAMARGETNPEVLADHAQGRLREKREQLLKALEGRMKPHHRVILTELLCQIDSLEKTIARMDQAIADYCAPFGQAVQLLDTIPGIARESAEVIVAEMGADMSRFPTANHLAAWAGLAPGNNESAGKRLAGKTRKGNRVLCSILVQVAHAASHVKKSYLAAQYHRLAARRGKKRALIAVAHSILVIAFHMLKRQESYTELGADYFDRRRPEATAKRLVKRLEQLGYQVTVQAPMKAATAA